jgi:hypothetical protein
MVLWDLGEHPRAMADLLEPDMGPEEKPENLVGVGMVLWDLGEHPRAVRLLELFVKKVGANAELAAFRSRLAAAREEEAVRVEAEFIARHLKEWNVADEQGVLYPITPQNVERTPEDLFVLLTPVVAGRTGGVEFVLGKSASPSASPATTPGG